MEDPHGDVFIVLRTHNGCDARGGFSAPTFWVPQEEYPDTYWRGEFAIDGHDLDTDCPAVDWEDLGGEDAPLPEDLTPEMLAADVAACIIAKGILYNGEGKSTPVDTLAYIWDNCGLTEYAATPRYRMGFAVRVDNDRAIGVVRTYEGAWESGEIYPY